jgi:hypothetical protein
MATIPITPSGVPVVSTNKTTMILAIIQASLVGLTLVPGLGAGVQVGEAFLAILLNALGAYQAETGKPLDFSKIPFETLVP